MQQAVRLVRASFDLEFGADVVVADFRKPDAKYVAGGAFRHGVERVAVDVLFPEAHWISSRSGTALLLAGMLTAVFRIEGRVAEVQNTDSHEAAHQIVPTLVRGGRADSG